MVPGRAVVVCLRDPGSLDVEAALAMSAEHAPIDALMLTTKEQ